MEHGNGVGSRVENKKNKNKKKVNVSFLPSLWKVTLYS
jgi:hypothetical protein